MLSEVSQAIAERDYHGLRCYTGAAPVTRQSGNKKVILMRQGCNQRLRNAVHHWPESASCVIPPAKLGMRKCTPKDTLVAGPCAA